MTIRVSKRPDRTNLEVDNEVTPKVVNKYLKDYGYKVYYRFWDDSNLLTCYGFRPIKVFYGGIRDEYNQEWVWAFGNFTKEEWKSKMYQVMKSQDKVDGTHLYRNTRDRGLRVQTNRDLCLEKGKWAW